MQYKGKTYANNSAFRAVRLGDLVSMPVCEVQAYKDLRQSIIIVKCIHSVSKEVRGRGVA